LHFTHIAQASVKASCRDDPIIDDERIGPKAARQRFAFATSLRWARMDITDNVHTCQLDQPPPARLGTFVDISQWRAERIADQAAFTFLSPAQDAAETIDYSHLDRRIRAIAAVLAENGRPGQRVLIVQQPGLDYIASLYGCMYAGMVAVPVYPLDAFRLRHTLPRLQAITRDADAPIMLTSSDACGGGDFSPVNGSQNSGGRTGPLWELCHQAVIFTDSIDPAVANAYRPRAVSPNDLALLQYTSGTTGKPRGVALRHRHLLANAQQIYGEYHVRDAVCVFWLPPYHDMGLVGGLLLPMFAGRQSVLMSPTSFVQQPIAWLKAISKYRGTTTASPNFGYELCLRKISDADLETLDLSSLQVAISGAEPIRATTLRRFSQRFHQCGFRSSAFTPAYGMAEATLAITGKPLAAEPTAVRFLAAELHSASKQAVPVVTPDGDESANDAITSAGLASPSATAQTIEIVGCGVPLDRTSVCVVDPDSCRQVNERTVGEIWVRGPSVADAYWQQPELAHATFKAQIAGDLSPDRPTYLRTGDLGFIHDGQLFVSGRLKDLIIIAGRNYFAHEIEAAIQARHEAFKSDGGVAFSLDSSASHGEALIIVQEVLRPKRFDLATLVETIRFCLAEQFELSPSAIVLVAAGCLSKTSSGKLQRNECRTNYLSDELQVLYKWQATVKGDDCPESSTLGHVAQSARHSSNTLLPESTSVNGPSGFGQVSPTPITQQVAAIWCEVLDLDQPADNQHFLDFGGHSLAAISLLARLRERVGISLDFETLFRFPRFGQLANECERIAATSKLATQQPQLPTANQTKDSERNGLNASNMGSCRSANSQAEASSEMTQRLPLTATQMRFWLLDQLEWRQAFMHVELTLRFQGPINLQRLTETIRDLPRYHDALRLRIVVDEAATPWQTFTDDSPLVAQQIDLRGNSATSSPKSIGVIRDELIHSPFDLTRGPMLRVAIVRLSDVETHLILVAHHLICDGSSLILLSRDLAARFNGSFDGVTGPSFAQAVIVDQPQTAAAPITQPALRSSLDYWTERLCDAPHDSHLSLDFLSQSAVERPSLYRDSIDVAEQVSDPDGAKHPEGRSGIRGQTPVPKTQLLAGRGIATFAPSRFRSLRVTPHLVELMNQRCHQWSVTPFEILLAAWYSVLSRYSQNEELIIGVPIAGRDRISLENTVGCFINTLPVRLTAARQESFASRVARISKLWRSDVTHGDVPLDAMIESLAIPRSVDRLPLIQHLVLHQPPVADPLRLGDAWCEDFGSDYSTLGAYDTAVVCQWRHASSNSKPQAPDVGSQADLVDTNTGDSTFNSATRGPSEWECELGIAYSQQLIDDSIADNMLAGLTTLLSDGLTEPDREAEQLACKGDAECQFIDLACRASRFHSNNDTILDLFRRQVARTPQQVAIIDGAGSMTFEELERLSSQIAAALRNRGLRPGSIAALRLRRGRRITLAALAIWKTGAAYLPLDPTYPPHRISDILDDAQPFCVIDDEDFDSLTEINLSDTELDPLPTVTAEQLAYLIYTSGSTGKPKGVMIGHDNLANVLLAFSENLGLAAGQKILASTTMSFDISILELYLPLVIGATSVITPKSLSDDPDEVLGFLSSHPIDVIQATPSSLRMMMAAAWIPHAGQTIWCGGEPLQIDLALTLTGAGASLWNVYGPTETTVWSLACELATPIASPISIGRPIDSTTIRIVDPVGRDVPVGISGELWIGGLGVGRGYWNLQELTADRFVDTELHGRMYRTGDTVRLLPQGQIEFLGRSDRQVKIRGHRVELGEIEAAINRCDRVAQAAVVMINVAANDHQIIAFFSARVAANDGHSPTISPAELRCFIESDLPRHMIPAALIPLSEIPHTPAGKIDYKKLPIDGCLALAMLQFEGSTPVSGAPGRLPQTTTEVQLAQIWREILGKDFLTIDDHFFHLGGHSLLAAQVFARMRTQLGVQIPLREIYAHPTIAELAILVDTMRQSTSSTHLELPLNDDPHATLRDRTADDHDSLAAFMRRKHSFASVRAGEELDAVDEPLSPAEQRLWFVDQLEPNHPFYNLPLAARVHGALDINTFWDSVDDCIARHETLRSTYQVTDGQPIRVVKQSLKLNRMSHDLRYRDERQSIVSNQIAELSRQAFDLAKGPLVRVVHWQVADEEHVILMVMHHIVSDGWSMSVMMRELAEFYRARMDSSQPEMRPLTATYRDYAAWQHQVLTPQRIEPTLDYWQQTLSDSVETLDLPTDFPRPAEQKFEGATRPIHISGELSGQVSSLAAQLQVTPFTVLLAAYGLLLSRISGQRDLTVGTAVANRPDQLVEDLIGFFVNTVVIRQHVEGTETFLQWVQKTQQIATEAIGHQDVAFEQVVTRLAKSRDRSHSPLFQAAFILQNTPDALVAAPGMTIVPMPVDNGTSKYDLTLFLTEHGGIFGGHFEYRTSLFRPETIDGFIDCFQTLLAAAIRSAEIELLASRNQHANQSINKIQTIDQLPILSTQAETAILRRSSIMANGHAKATTTLNELFAQSVGRYKNQLAIRHGHRQMSYDELDRYAQRIARGLQIRGVSTGDRVMVCMARSIDQVATILAVLRCGAAFVPIDTQVPPRRIATIAVDLDPVAVIVDDEVYEDILGHLATNTICHRVAELAIACDGKWASVQISPFDLAYLIFTSGSTGTPKGVAIEHRSIANFVLGFATRLGLSATMKCAYLFSPSFDGALGDVFPALASGASLEVIDQTIAVDSERLAQYLNDCEVEMVAMTPATLGMLDPANLPTVKKLLSAGASLPGELAGRWLKTHELYNGYGPTECAVGVTVHRIDASELSTPSVGKPLPNTWIYVLDASRHPVPDGVIGEVYIGGDGVARGYWRQQELTARSFVPDPFTTSGIDSQQNRMYRTGDLGRWTRSGNLEIVGRCDEQIKLRGYRIEPGEISAVLDSLAGVRQSAVIAWGSDDPGIDHDKVDHSVTDQNDDPMVRTHSETGAGKRLIAYVVTHEAHASELQQVQSVEQVRVINSPSPAADLSSPTREIEVEHVENWRYLFDQAKQSGTVVLDPADDFSGWSSVITGRSIPTVEMRAWADATADRISQLNPKKVLEIGCGTGLILLRIGGFVESYTGIDVLESAISELRHTLLKRPDLYAKVQLSCQTADALDNLESGSFDTIVLNSVAQYFPSEDYLIRVLREAERLLAPGGKVFLGDLRNLRLQRAFAIAAELHKCQNESITVGQFRSLVRNRIEHDEELLIDPDLMPNLDLHLKRLSGVTRELKTAMGDNELNRFRFDAVLWFDTPPPTLGNREVMTAYNANVHREVMIDRMLTGSEDSVNLSMRLSEIDASILNAVDPFTLQSACAKLGWKLSIDWHPLADDAMTVTAHTQAGIVPANLLRQKLHLVEHEINADTHSLSTLRSFTSQPLTRRRSMRMIQQWRKELQTRLPAYMVPATFVVVDKLPMTIQGKLDRSALPPPPSQRYTTTTEIRKPSTATQRCLVEIWEELLEVSPIGIDDDFFEIGGHSMLAVRMVSQVRQRTGLTLPLAALFRKPTIDQLSELLDNPRSCDSSLLVPLAVGGSAEPLFCIHPAGGTVFCYRDLASRFAGRRPIFGIQARGLDGREKPHVTLIEMASDYADAIIATVATGRIHLVGWSLGGNIAYEVARQLTAKGREVGTLALLDAGLITSQQMISEDDFLPLIAALFPGQNHESLEALRQKSPTEQLAYFIDQAAKAGIVPDDPSLIGPHVFDVFQANIKAVHHYQPAAFDTSLLLIRPGDQLRTSDLFDDQCLGWKSMGCHVNLVTVTGDHAHMLQSPAVEQIAAHLTQYLAISSSGNCPISICDNVGPSGIEHDPIQC